MEFWISSFGLDEDSPELIEDKYVAKTLFDIAREVAVHELQHMRYYSCRPPARSLGLLSTDMEVQQKTQQWCKALLEALYVIEEYALRDPWFADYLRDMQWPCNSMDLEQLTSLKECDHKSVPVDVEADLRSEAIGMNGSVINEDGFRDLNARARTHSAGFMGRAARYHQLLVGPTMNAYERELLPVTPLAKAAKCTKLNPEIFECPRIDQFSLGTEFFEKFKDHKVWAWKSIEMES